jgi:hypothetical protein
MLEEQCADSEGDFGEEVSHVGAAAGERVDGDVV